MNALEVLHAVTRTGGRLIPNGDKITMEAPTPLPADLIAQIRQHKPALLAILHPNPPRYAGGMLITDKRYPCVLCGGIEWQQHVTYRYCRTCGREDGPGAVVDNRKERWANVQQEHDMQDRTHDTVGTIKRCHADRT